MGWKKKVVGGTSHQTAQHSHGRSHKVNQIRGEEFLAWEEKLQRSSSSLGA